MEVKKLSAAIRSTWRLIKNFHNTTAVFDLYRTTPLKHNRALFRRLRNCPEGRELLKRKFGKIPLDKEYLASYPLGTLGHEMSKMVIDNLYEVSGEKGYLAQHLTSLHDVLHVLTGYDCTPRQEAALQAFTYHHITVPAPFIIGWGHVILFPWRFREIHRAWKWGKSVPWLVPVDWSTELDTPVEELRIKYGLVKPDDRQRTDSQKIQKER